ncbi:hypothetical protein AB0N07_39175 [Streptomyces sp. NPDC051172]|uniref:hypothetical protein n=1 Tax=Streptomyces sp. NPDC051172 TaxID=3155796 RepID=UPI00343442AC
MTDQQARAGPPVAVEPGGNPCCVRTRLPRRRARRLRALSSPRIGGGRGPQRAMALVVELGDVNPAKTA